jgi:NAD-dependent deacetylase
MTRVHEELVSADVCLVIGTSALVQPSASFPLVVKHSGGKILEFNVERTPLTPASDVHVSGKAGEILPGINQLLQNLI